MRPPEESARPLLSATADHHGGVHQLSTGELVLLPDREEFYAALTQRNRGLIDEVEQTTLRRASILVAGCGAIGGSAIDALLRAGSEALTLVDASTYQLSDANREVVRLQDLGRSKAEVIARRAADINPFAQVATYPDNDAGARLAALLGGADIVIDGIEADDAQRVETKFNLHRLARDAAKPVVAGFDVAGTQWAATYDYREGGRRPLDGRVTEADFPGLQPVAFLERMLTAIKMPIEIVPEVERQLRGQALFLPHLGSTAQMFGALVVQIVLDLLMRRPVRPNVVVDIPGLVRPTRENVKVAGRRLAMMYVMHSRLRGLRRSGRLGVFSPLEDETFAGMRDIMEERAWDEGSVIFYQGEPGDAFYVVAEGQVQIERELDELSEPEVIAVLGPGDFFGEQALLSDAPRNATVVAATQCRLLSLSRDAFETYLRESEAAGTRVRAVARERVAPTE
jgi:CRP-like cAMP-binding protein